MRRTVGVGVPLVLTVAATPPLAAQDVEQAKREAMYNRYLGFASYVKGGVIEPHWMADGSSFWYADDVHENTVIWKVDPAANSKVPLFDTAQLHQALSKVLSYELPHQGLPFHTFAFVDGERAVRFTVEDTEFILSLDSYEIRRAPAPAEEGRIRAQSGEVLSPDGRWIATVKDHNLWLTSAADGRQVQLTSDGVQDYEWVLHPILQRHGAKWSPDGSILAATKEDYRQAPKIPLVDWLGSKEEVEWSLFDRKPGLPIREVELSLIDVPSGRRSLVETGEEPGSRVSLLGWLSDGSELLFFSRGDSGRPVRLMAADARTGSTRLVLSEEHPVRQRSDGPRTGETPFTALEDGRRFVWLSGRTGWRHLYLYDLAGHLVRPLTQGEFPVERVVRLDETAGWVYFTARGDHERPYDTHLYRVSLEGAGLTRLTEAAGQHRIQFAPSGRFFLDTHSNVDRAPAVELRRADGELLQTLETANVDALKDLHWSPPEEFVVQASDGETDLYGVLHKPYDFHPDKKYPVILYTAPLTRTFTGSGALEGRPVWPQAMAQLGFITFSVDVREPVVSSRGGEFDRVTAGTIGRYEVPDYVAALKGLAADRPFMDISRVGVIGLSYGGYLAIRAMLQAPDDFHVGVAVAAITDSYGHPNFYRLGSPRDNREAFEDASNLSLAGNLKGRLLLVQGTHDTAVPFSHAMKMIDALTRAGKLYDLLVLPGWGHWWPDTEEWERYRLEAYCRYFQEHLKP